MTTRRFWVFVEQEDGQVHPVSWELLGVTGRLVAEAKAEAGAEVVLEAVLLGHQAEALAQATIQYGAERVYLLDDPELRFYRNKPYSVGVAALAEKYKPEVFLVGATTLGRDLAGAVATRLRTGLTADCTQLQMGEVKNSPHKLLLATRPAFGGNVIATILCRDRLPQMATVRPRVFPQPPHQPEAKGEIVRETVPELAAAINVQIVELLRDQASQVNIEYADIIVAGGRGLGSPAGFALIKELADALGGMVGASRACVDAGWIGYEHQVGQTGKTVRPKLYIAAGISGAIQHKVGMQNSDFILAINRDPQAPIFDIAHFGIVGDLYQVIPELIKQVRQHSAVTRQGADPHA